MSKRNDLYCLCVELRGHSSWQDHWRRSRPGVIVYLFNWQNYQRPSPHAQAWRHCNTYQPQSRHSQGNEIIFIHPVTIMAMKKDVEIREFARMPKVLCVGLEPTYIQDRKCSTIQCNELPTDRTISVTVWSITNMVRIYARFSVDIVVRYTELSWNIFSDCF